MTRYSGYRHGLQLTFIPYDEIINYEGEYDGEPHTITHNDIPNDVLSVHYRYYKEDDSKPVGDAGWNEKLPTFTDAGTYIVEAKINYFSGTTVIKEGFVKIKKPTFIEVVVPAVWIPVDKDTNEVLDYLTPIPTIPDMYPRPEVARWNDAFKDGFYNSNYEGEYVIDYMGVPQQEPGSNSANNFMYTANLFFTDKFHRVVAQGRNDRNFGEDTSAVRKLVYGDYIEEYELNSDNKPVGLHGMKRTPYQEGVTMKLYIATETEDTSLSEATFEKDILDFTYGNDHDLLKETLYNNIKKVSFNDFDNWAQIRTINGIENQLELRERLGSIYLYKYDSDSKTTGQFIKEGEEYKDFNLNGFEDLEEGFYEVVFPIYWNRNVPDYMSAPDVFSRNRYQYDDTIHFTLNFQLPKIEVNVSKDWSDANDQDGLRPEDVTIKLLADGEPTNETLTLSPANNWTDNFTNLDEYAAGRKIDYSIEEVSVPGYNTVITGSMADGFTVTNSHTPEAIPPTLTLEKLVEESSFSQVGDELNYSFAITNTGELPLVKLTVNDPKLGIEDLIIDLTDDPIMPGETYTHTFNQAYVISAADVEAGKVDNELTVIGETPEGATIELTDSVTVPMERVLPHIPKTGEHHYYHTSLVALVLGGAFVIMLIKRRQQLKQD